METGTNNVFTEAKSKLRMSGARSRKYPKLRQRGLTREEAVVRSTHPSNSDEHPHKLSYSKLKDMSYMLPNAKLRNSFWYKVAKQGKDPDLVIESMLSDPSVKERLGGYKLIGCDSQLDRKKLSVETTISGRHETPLSRQKGNIPAALPRIVSSSRMTWDDADEPSVDSYNYRRRNRSVDGPEEDWGVHDSRDRHRSKYRSASTSQMERNEDDRPPDQIDMEIPYDDVYPRLDRSCFGSEFYREESERDRGKLRDTYGSPRWEISHPRLDGEDSRDSYGRSRSRQSDQDDFWDYYDRPGRSYVHSEEGWPNVKARYDTPRFNRSNAGSDDGRETVCDWSDIPSRYRSHRNLDHEDKYSSPRRERSVYTREFQEDSRGSHHPSPRDSLHRSEPDKKDIMHGTPKEPSRSPTLSKHRSRSTSTLKNEYENFLRNLNWAPPPQIASTSGTSHLQPSSNKRKLSRIAPVVPPSLSFVPAKRSKRDGLNPAISSLMDPTRWETSSEEPEPSWKQDYQRFLQNESWKQDYRRFLEKVDKGETSSNPITPSQSGVCLQPQKNETNPNNKESIKPMLPRAKFNATAEELGSGRHQARGSPPMPRQDKKRSGGMRPNDSKTSPTPSGRQSTKELYHQSTVGSGPDRPFPTTSSLRMATVKTPEKHPRSPIFMAEVSSAGASSRMDAERLQTEMRDEWTKYPENARERRLPWSSPGRDRPSAALTKYPEKHPHTTVFIVPTNDYKACLSDEQIDVIESSILEAILDINDGHMKPSFQQSFRRNGKFGVVCNDQFSKNWLHNHIRTCRPWPNASLKMITADSTKVRVSVKLPLCKNDDNERILKFIIKQNVHLNAQDWIVFHRLDSETDTSVMFLVDEDSVSGIRDCGKINFKMGRVDAVIEGDKEVEEEPSEGVVARPCLSAERSGSSQHEAIANWIAPLNTREDIRFSLGRPSILCADERSASSWSRAGTIQQGFGAAISQKEARGGSLQLGARGGSLQQGARGGSSQQEVTPNRRYSDAFRECQPRPFQNQDVLTPPPPHLLGDALVRTRRDAEPSSERRSFRTPSAETYGRPHQAEKSQPDRIPTSGGIIWREGPPRQQSRSYIRNNPTLRH